MPDWTERFSDHARRALPSVIRGLDRIPQAEDTISFGAGAPDETVFPTEVLGSILAAIMSDKASAEIALQYGPTEGILPLRRAICAHMAALGVTCAPENVLITNGSQQGLHLASEALLNAGDRVLVDRHSYPGALQVFAALGTAAVTAEMLPAGTAVPLVYVTPTFQNPTGQTLTLDERRALLADARKRDAVVIEDDPYEALRYGGTAPTPILSLDIGDGTIEQSRVVYLGTFSKSAVPGFRIGWTVGASAMIEKMALLKQTEDLQPGSLSQMVLARFMDGAFEAHTARLRDHYRARRDALASALRSEIGNRAAWNLPDGGCFFWLTLPEAIDAEELLRLAAPMGVTFIPGAAFSPPGQGRNALRLSFSHCPVPRIGEGMRRLASAIDTLTH